METQRDIRAVMFDLDGTLADTVAGLAAAGNHMRAAFDLPPIDTAAYNYIAGQGVRSLVVHCLENTTDEAAIEMGTQLFREFQDTRSHEYEGIFDGIPQLLNTCTELGLAIAVLSNKAHPATVDNVQRFFSDWQWNAVEGAKPDLAVKPDPVQARHISERLDIAPEHWMYVGDTAADMGAASAMGFLAVGVLWGFRDEPELREAGAEVIVSHPSEVAALLQQTAVAK